MVGALPSEAVAPTLSTLEMLRLPAGAWVSVAAMFGPASVLAAPAGLAQEVLEAEPADTTFESSADNGSADSTSPSARTPRDMAIACLCADGALPDGTRAVLKDVLNSHSKGRRNAWRDECATVPRMLGA